MGGRRNRGKYRKKDRAVTDADSEIPTRKETGRYRDWEREYRVWVDNTAVRVDKRAIKGEWKVDVEIRQRIRNF